MPIKKKVGVEPTLLRERALFLQFDVSVVNLLSWVVTFFGVVEGVQDYTRFQ